MSDSKGLGRREFVVGVTGILGGIMSAVIVVPALAYLAAPATQVETTDTWLPLGPIESFPVGQPAPVSFTRTKTNGWERTVNSLTVFVTRFTDNEVQVLSNRCTHLSCRVKWDDKTHTYDCPCHDASFGPKGEVLSGPPPHPLDAYPTKIEAGILFMHLTEA